jgi:hypothetical protein
MKCFETITDTIAQNSITLPSNTGSKPLTPIPFLHIPSNVLCYFSSPFVSGCISQLLLNSDILKFCGLQFDCEYPNNCLNVVSSQGSTILMSPHPTVASFCLVQQTFFVTIFSTVIALTHFQQCCFISTIPF